MTARNSDHLTVIAIDGPAGSGKSTVARALATQLGLEYLDTGAMYRAVAFAALRQGVDVQDLAAVADLAENLDIEVSDRGVTADGVDATIEIRSPEVTRAVTAVAANSEVRKNLVQRQRAWAAAWSGGVMEGRDIGTVVFPDARLKVYLTASAEVRAARRSREMNDADYDSVAADITRRDTRDSTRAASPLIQAEDALTVDTSDLTVDQIVQLIIGELT